MVQLVRLRGIVTAVMGAVLAAALHALAFQWLAASPPALRAYGPAGEAWNRVTLAAAELAVATWLGRQALWARRLERIESFPDPFAGCGGAAAALALGLLATATVLLPVPSSLAEWATCTIVGILASAVLLFRLRAQRPNGSAGRLQSRARSQ